VDRCLLVLPSVRTAYCRPPTVFGAFLFTVQVTDSSVPPKTAPPITALLVNRFPVPRHAIADGPLRCRLQQPAASHWWNTTLLITLTSGVFPSGWGLRITSSAALLRRPVLTPLLPGHGFLGAPQSATVTLTLGVTTPLAITTTLCPAASSIPLTAPRSQRQGGSGQYSSAYCKYFASRPRHGFARCDQRDSDADGNVNFTVVAVRPSLPPQTFTQPESITITNPVRRPHDHQYQHEHSSDGGTACCAPPQYRGDGLGGAPMPTSRELSLIARPCPGASGQGNLTARRTLPESPRYERDREQRRMGLQSEASAAAQPRPLVIFKVPSATSSMWRGTAIREA